MPAQCVELAWPECAVAKTRSAEMFVDYQAGILRFVNIVSRGARSSAMAEAVSVIDSVTDAVEVISSETS